MVISLFTTLVWHQQTHEWCFSGWWIFQTAPLYEFRFSSFMPFHNCGCPIKCIDRINDWFFLCILIDFFFWHFGIHLLIINGVVYWISQSVSLYEFGFSLFMLAHRLWLFDLRQKYWNEWLRLKDDWNGAFWLFILTFWRPPTHKWYFFIY